MEITYELVNINNMDLYVKTGLQSYHEHYLYLWEDENPESYLSISFNDKTVRKELADLNCENYLVKANETIAGVLKISFDKGQGQWPASDSLYLHRIYLLDAYAGNGIGKATLEFVDNRAKHLKKKIVWLEAMKTSKALAFYQKNGFSIVDETVITLKGIKASERQMWILVKNI